MSKLITPTVGRKVYYYEDDKQAEPHDATIIKVWSPADQANPFSAVNLRVTDPLSGATRLETSVVASAVPVPHPHYRWMPYQVGQAAKTEEAEKQASSVVVHHHLAVNQEQVQSVHGGHSHHIVDGHGV
jgi:hypothetical protein